MPAFHPSQSQPRSAQLGVCTALALAVSLLLFCLYLLTATPLALAQSTSDPPTVDSESGDQTVFTRDDGLAANSVTALLRQDRVLWIGTMAGLSRYTVHGRDAGLVWEAFTQADGMAADAVSDLWSDDNGGLWVAHPDRSISFFDGDTWTTYDSPTQTLNQAYRQIVNSHASGPLWAIEEGGRVWTLAEGTVGYYVGAVWRPYGEDAGIPRGDLVAVWTGDGAWVASETGQIGYFDDANWSTFRDLFDAVQREYETIVEFGPPVGPLWVVDEEGAVWVRNAFNQRNPRPDVRRYFEGRWTNFSSGNGMATGFVEELRLDEYGRIWARHAADDNGQGGGLSLFQGGAPDQPAGADAWTAIVPAVDGNVTDFWPEGTDGVWIASFSPALSDQDQASGVPVGGLTYVTLNTWQRSPLDAFEAAAISAAWLDENGNFWLGLSGDPRRRLAGGLWRYRPARRVQAAAWTPVAGLVDDDVRDLWGDGLGNLWVATAGGVNRITLSNRRMVSYTQPIQPDRISGDAEGNVWAVALGEEGGVWGWDGSAWASYTVSEGLSGGAYADIHVSADGSAYLASDRGLDIWDGEAWKTFATLPGRNTKRIWQDALGDLWLSSEITPGRPFNLSLKQGTRWQTLLSENDSRPIGAEPLNLLRDGRGHVWLGAPLGLFVYEMEGDSRWRGLGPVEGVSPGPVPALFEDTSATVWAAVGEQAYRADPTPCGFGSAQSSTQPSTGVCGDWRRFDPQVGVLSHIIAGPDESIFFAGDAGVALYYPNPPDLRLDRVVNLITGEEYNGRTPIVLTLGRNAIRIDLAALAPTLATHQITYRYRLEGVDEDWRIAPARALGGKQASITYAGLVGGVYTFTATARAQTFDASLAVNFQLRVISRPPQLVLDSATVGGQPAEHSGALTSYVGQPIQIQLTPGDDQLAPLTYRYQIEGLNDNWTETVRSEISFTLSAAGTYTFVALALDQEGQTSPRVGAQIVVSDRSTDQDSDRLPVETIATIMGALAVLFILSAIVLIIRHRRRVSW